MGVIGACPGCNYGGGDCSVFDTLTSFDLFVQNDAGPGVDYDYDYYDDDLFMMLLYPETGGDGNPIPTQVPTEYNPTTYPWQGFFYPFEEQPSGDGGAYSYGIQASLTSIDGTMTVAFEVVQYGTGDGNGRGFSSFGIDCSLSQSELEAYEDYTLAPIYRISDGALRDSTIRVRLSNFQFS